MQIKVTREFAGRITQERRIYPGEYALNDEALFGVGQYLLDNGFAVWVDDSGIPVPVPQSMEPVVAPRVVDEIEFKGRTIQRLASEGWSDDQRPIDVAGELPPVDYSDFTIAELKDLLDARGVDYSNAKRKDDFVALASVQG